jgi:signal transduction histidine kinase
MTGSERLRRAERLLEITRDLNRAMDLEPLLHRIIAAASELTHCEAASILAVEDGGKELAFLALPWFHREALKPVKVPIAASIAGWVIQNGQPAVVPDVSAERRHFKGADQAVDFTTRSLLAVPIVFHDERLGVLEAVNKAGGSHYTEEDLTILETLAAQAGIVMQYNRLVRRAQSSANQMTDLDRMKTDFIAIASHELRTPLGLILGHATFLREVIQAEQRPQLDIIVRNALRLKEIIDNIANMDNVERGMASVRRAPVSMKQVIEEVVAAFREDIEKKQIALLADTGQDELVVEVDASKISLALSNLVENAAAFTDPNGHIYVVAGKIPGHVKVSVIDDGIGIPAKDLPRVFERFYQVESHLTRKHGGMGLGLSVAKVMIEMHGGRIWVESVEGKGSNFTFLLPVESGQASANKVFVS